MECMHCYACSKRYLTINFFFVPFLQRFQRNTEIGVRNPKYWPTISAANSKFTTMVTNEI